MAENRKNNYKDISWDVEDLISCKQGLIVSLRAGMPIGEVYNYDFGCLDVDSVLEEEGYELPDWNKYAYIIECSEIIPSSVMKYDYWFTSYEKACQWARDTYDELLDVDDPEFYVHLHRVDGHQLECEINLIPDEEMYYLSCLENILSSFCIKSNQIDYETEI